MKKLLLFLISFLGIFSACDREPVTPFPGGDGIDTTIRPLYGVSPVIYAPKAAAEEAVSEGQREKADVADDCFPQVSQTGAK